MPQPELKEMAAEIIHRHDVESFIEAEQLVELAGDFEKWMRDTFEIKTIRQNHPIKAHFNGQLLSTEIDCLLETGSGFQLIVHSGLVGEKKAMLKKSKDMAGRMAGVKRAVQQTFGVVSVGVYIHFVLSGAIVQLEV